MIRKTLAKGMKEDLWEWDRCKLLAFDSSCINCDDLFSTDVWTIFEIAMLPLLFSFQVKP